MTNWLSLAKPRREGEEYFIPDADAIRRYKHLREVAVPFNTRILETADRNLFLDGAKDLGMFRGKTIVFNAEDESSILMDYCLQDVRRNGQNTLERFLVQTPPADSDEMLYLKAAIEATYTILSLEEMEPGRGCYVRDYFAEKRFFLTDVSMSRSSTAGMAMATRIMTIEGLTITSGAGLPIPMNSPQDLDALFRAVQPKAMRPGPSLAHREDCSQRTRKIIRYCLDRGASERVRYATPNEPLSPRYEPAEFTPRPIASSPTHVGRNDPCPCGSGKKSKKCCSR